MMSALRSCKDEGLEFTVAWDESWATVIWPHDTTHRRQWKVALKSQRPEIEAAYRDLPTRTARLFRDLDLSLLLADESEEVMDVPRAIAA